MKLTDKWIEGFTGVYRITVDGKVISFKQNKKNGKILRPKIVGGYKMVNLGSYPNNDYRYVHKLVAEAFVKNPKPKVFDIVIFDNRDKNDIRPGNLKWSTQQDNLALSHKQRKKELKDNGKFTKSIRKEDVPIIAHLMKNSAVPGRVDRIAQVFNVSSMTIRRLLESQDYIKSVKLLEK